MSISDSGGRMFALGVFTYRNCQENRGSATMVILSLGPSRALTPPIHSSTHSLGKKTQSITEHGGISE